MQNYNKIYLSIIITVFNHGNKIEYSCISFVPKINNTLKIN